jgi:broad-specificity NMP kinase
MMTVVLGASGSGKTSVAPLLRDVLPGHVVIDWDAFWDVAGALAGVDVLTHPELWPAYLGLVRAVVESVGAVPTVLLTSCDPEYMGDWDIDRWILVDCDDDERRRRLAGRGTAEHEIAAAVAVANGFRSLGMHAIDTTALTPAEVAAHIRPTSG